MLFWFVVHVAFMSFVGRIFLDVNPSYSIVIRILRPSELPSRDISVVRFIRIKIHLTDSHFAHRYCYELPSAFALTAIKAILL